MVEDKELSPKQFDNRLEQYYEYKEDCSAKCDDKLQYIKLLKECENIEVFIEQLDSELEQYCEQKENQLR